MHIFSEYGRKAVVQDTGTGKAGRGEGSAECLAATVKQHRQLEMRHAENMG